MMDETRRFAVELDDGKRCALGELYDQTPKELISKVMLEDKVFWSWHNGRVILIGDAFHKLNSSGGHGAVTAMYGAIALSNLMYAMPIKASADITKILEEYQEERYPAVMELFENSQLMAKISARGIIGAILLYFFSHMPFWLWKLTLAKVEFLKPILVPSLVIPFVSPSERKAIDCF